MFQAKLLVVGGGEVEHEEYLLSLPATIGRGRENLITLPHPLVSRRHCEIFEGDAGLMVRDLGSLNGTYVGNKRIKEPHRLEPGDLLTIGIVTFRTVLPNVTEKGVRLESVYEEDDVVLPEGDTTLAAERWGSDTASGETDALSDETPPDANPRRAK